MNVPITRRSVGCVSDLTIDRWLLGETPGSDEARRLEEHMKHCAVCAARLGSLRNLYTTQPSSTATTTAHALDEAPRATPSETGVLQVIVLRDGLLVGTEYFTPGKWLVGSGKGCDLNLAEGPAARHASIVFHAGTVAVESREGPIFVNGVRLQRAEVRPIDEVWVGPYVLRVRLITERWSWPAMVTAPVKPQELPTVVMERPATPPVTRLHATLWWGDTQVASLVALDQLEASQVSALGFDAGVYARREAGQWKVTTPSGVVSLSLNEATSLEAQALRLVLTVREPAAPLPKARRTERLFPAVLVATVLASAALLVVMPEPSEEDFAPRHIPPVKVVVAQPTPRQAPPQPSAAPTPNTPPAVATRASSKSQRASPPPPRNRFEALDRVMKSAQNVSTTLARAGASAKTSGARNPLVAMPGGGPAKFTLGLADSALGIGRPGAIRGGEMRSGGYGVDGKVGGRVVGPVRAASLGLPKKEGGVIDRDAVAKVIGEHLPEVQRCYEASLLLEGSAGGRLSVEWTITPSGSVTNARVSSTTLKQASVPQCVLMALKRWAFPRAKGGNVVISYPFVFQSSMYR
ncbi:MAG: AgmX/PglI C-terminal domain-containing protein [Archangium sp.]|nr:AgmX/PglI C-terminal domain-containing protein [Archangium sp.]